jgi:cytochrome c556
MRRRFAVPVSVVAAVVAVVVVAWMTSLACSGPALWRYEETLEQTPVTSTHAVHDRRLAELMRKLEGLREERLPQALDVRTEEAKQAREIARVARAMARSASTLPGAAPPELDATARAEFGALAASLERSCEQLADGAVRSTPEQLRARLAEIDATCDRCHSRFRIRGDPHADR